MSTAKSLDKALKRAKRIAFDLQRDRYVVMSDQHMGDGRRGSDDFRKNRGTYSAALNHYFDGGHGLISLGDVEELWECDFPDIQRTYPDVYEAEKRFFDAHRLFRIHGNHDIFWRNGGFLRRFLRPFFPAVPIYESLRLDAAEGTIFLTHGHQGEFFSHRLWRVTRLIVRHVWKPLQRLLRIPATGAAQNVKKRNRKELEYYEWAKEKKLLFIAGHTHRAMFASLSEIDRLRAVLSALMEKRPGLPVESEAFRENSVEIRDVKEKLRTAIDKEFREKPEPLFEAEGETSPCYFNDGCCSYTTGMTALEIEGGRIRLVKWDRATRRRTVYEEEDLAALFAKIRSF